MKRQYWFIVFILFLLSGCMDNRSNSQNWMVANNRIKVLCTTAMVGDLVKEIGGEKIDIFVLIKNGLDPHSYQLVKGDNEKLAFAEIVFYNGLGLEHGPGLQQFLENSEKSISLGDEIYHQEPSEILFYQDQPDPHIWMDVSLWAKSIPIIVAKLSSLDPEHTEEYRENGERLNQELERLHQKMGRLIRVVPERSRYLVTSHDAFNYFTRAYLAEPNEADWSKRFVAPEGLSPDSQLSSKEIRMSIDHIIIHQIKVLFPESNVSRSSLHKVIDAARLMEVPLVLSDLPLYGDAMGGKNSGAETYMSMMEYNAKTIAGKLGEMVHE